MDSRGAEWKQQCNALTGARLELICLRRKSRRLIDEEEELRVAQWLLQSIWTRERCAQHSSIV